MVARFTSAALAACCLTPTVDAQTGPAGEPPPVASSSARRNAGTLSASATVSTNGNSVGGDRRAGGTELNSDMNASFRDRKSVV